jgi:hypothetical protein
MSDIRQKATALLNEVLTERGRDNVSLSVSRQTYMGEALCRAIERHEATKQEYSDFRQLVSDVVEQADLLDLHGTEDAYKKLNRFIIPAPKPDPLVEVIEKCAGRTYPTTEDAAKEFRAALDARGFEIREKGQ